MFIIGRPTSALRQMPTPLKIIFAGSGEFGSPTLRSLVDGGHDIVQVFTQPDRPAGRGKKLTPTPISQLATERRLPLLATANINTESLPPADVMIVIAFGQKIAERAVIHPRLGSINLHASQLPKYRGAAPINWAILNGERTTGNSIIRLANKMDAGAILAQSELTIGETETAGELHDRLANDGALLIAEVLEELASGTARELEQDHTAATIAPKLSREMAVIDWRQPGEVIVRRINGLSPWPGCRMQLIDSDGHELGRVTLLSAGLAAGGLSNGKAGMVLEGGQVASGDTSQSIEILQLQPEGKRPMSLQDYRRGNRWAPNMRLQSI